LQEIRRMVDGRMLCQLMYARSGRAVVKGRMLGGKAVALH
jgi:hypothetical protein